MVHIVDKLREDHGRFAELFERIGQSTDGSAERRGNLARSLGRALSANAAFKETVFYPVIREAGDDEATQLVAEAISEHQETDLLIARMREMEPASAEFTGAVRELEQSVRRRIEREETGIFPIALRVIGRDEAEEMSERHDTMAPTDA